MTRDTSNTTDAGVQSPESMLNSLPRSDESADEMSMYAVNAAQASAACARAHRMFSRVLAGWASDVLRLERERRLGRHWPGCTSDAIRHAA